MLPTIDRATKTALRQPLRRVLRDAQRPDHRTLASISLLHVVGALPAQCPGWRHRVIGERVEEVRQQYTDGAGPACRGARRSATFPPVPTRAAHPLTILGCVEVPRPHRRGTLTYANSVEAQAFPRGRPTSRGCSPQGGLHGDPVDVGVLLLDCAVFDENIVREVDAYAIAGCRGPGQLPLHHPEILPDA